jgi:hypothetical protein
MDAKYTVTNIVERFRFSLAEKEQVSTRIGNSKRITTQFVVKKPQKCQNSTMASE